MAYRTLFLAALCAAFIGIAVPASAHEGGKPCYGNMHEKSGENWEHHPDWTGGDRLNLSDEERSTLRQAMQQSFEHDKPLFEKSMHIHKKLEKILATDPFDKAKFLELSGRLEHVQIKIQHDHMEMLTNFAEKLPAEKRKSVMALAMPHNMGMHPMHCMQKGEWHGEGGDGRPWPWHHGTAEPMEQPQASQAMPPVSMMGVSSGSTVWDKDYPPYSQR